MDSCSMLKDKNDYSSIGVALGLEARMASYAMYAMGLLGDGDRKSMESIAARVCPDADGVSAAHQCTSQRIRVGAIRTCAKRQRAMA